MSRLQKLGVAACLLLLVAIAIFGVRISRHYRGLRTEVGRFAITRLEERTLDRLRRLRDKVFVTYYVTERARMPSHLRRLEREVTDFLEALKRASNGRVDYQILDPEKDPDLAGYAARRRVSPLRVRHLERDAYSEETIWSSLTIAYGPYKPAEIGGVTPEHLPRLQTLFVEELDQMERPRRAVVALAPKTAFYELQAALAEHATVVRVDLDGGEPLPAEADAIFWMDPLVVTPTRLRELSGFIKTGRSLVIAGAEQVAKLELAGGEPTFSLTATGYPAEDLLGEFGLRPVRVLACDGRLLLCREAAAARQRLPLPGRRPVTWDGRFLVPPARAFGLPAGRVTVARLGGAGWRAIRAAEPALAHRPVPAAVRPSLPALIDPDGVLAVPHLGYTRRDATAYTAREIRFAPRNPLAPAAFVVAPERLDIIS